MVAFRAGLSLGTSRHWSEALEAMTGERKQSGKALLEYFEPLYKYLKEENSKLQSAAGRIDIEENTTTVKAADHTVSIAIAGFVGIAAIIGVIAFVMIKRKK